MMIVYKIFDRIEQRAGGKVRAFYQGWYLFGVIPLYVIKQEVEAR